LLDITDQKQTVAELKSRVRQQEAVAKLGLRALTGITLDVLMSEAAAVVAQTLDVEFSQGLEALADGKAFRPRAGKGWKPAAGEAQPIPAAGSQAGYTLHTDGPVIVEDLRTERRFPGAKCVHDHGIVSGISTLIHGASRPFGVLSAHTTTRRQFTRDDAHFLQAVANVLAAAIERKQAEGARNRLVAILEATTDLVAIAGTDRRLLYLNRAGQQLLGFGEEEPVTGRNLADFYPEEVRDSFLNDAARTAISKGVWS